MKSKEEEKIKEEKWAKPKEIESELRKRKEGERKSTGRFHSLWRE